MEKVELFKKCQGIMLATSGDVEDYVVALCQMSNLITEYADEKDRRITELEEENSALKEEMPTTEDVYEHSKEMAQGWEDDLRKQIAVLERALKLACETIVFNLDTGVFVENMPAYYINQAEKELKNG